MTYFNPYITGLYNPQYKTTNQYSLERLTTKNSGAWGLFGIRVLRDWMTLMDISIVACGWAEAVYIVKGQAK